MEQQGVKQLNLWTMGTTCGTMLLRKVSDLQWQSYCTAIQVRSEYRFLIRR
jgi:hypothetical protein